MEMQNDQLTTEAPASSLPHFITSQPHSTSQSTSLRSLPTDSAAVRYHVISTPRDSDCESGIVHTSVQLNVSGSARSTGDVSSVRNNRGQVSEERRRRNKYRRRRNRIGLLLVFATLLLFAGLVVCANTKEYFAGATISVIGVLLGSSSLVLCLLTTDSCERVHGFRERVSSFSRPNHRRNAASDRRTTRQQQRNGDGALASVSAANSSLNVHDTMIVHTLPPTAVCNISGDFLDHLPPPTYETAEILLREDMARDQGFVGETSGAVGGPSDYQYYKISQGESAAATPTASVSNLAATSAPSPSTSHLCEECVHRQQSADVNNGGNAPEDHVLIAPTIVVELPTYDEAIAEDKDNS